MAHYAAFSVLASLNERGIKFIYDFPMLGLSGTISDELEILFDAFDGLLLERLGRASGCSLSTTHVHLLAINRWTRAEKITIFILLVQRRLQERNMRMVNEHLLVLGQMFKVINCHRVPHTPLVALHFQLLLLEPMLINSSRILRPL